METTWKALGPPTGLQTEMAWAAVAFDDGLMVYISAVGDELVVFNTVTCRETAKWPLEPGASKYATCWLDLVALHTRAQTAYVASANCLTAVNIGSGSQVWKVADLDTWTRFVSACSTSVAALTGSFVRVFNAATGAAQYQFPFLVPTEPRCLSSFLGFVWGPHLCMLWETKINNAVAAVTMTSWSANGAMVQNPAIITGVDVDSAVTLWSVENNPVLAFRTFDTIGTASLDKTTYTVYRHLSTQYTAYRNVCMRLTWVLACVH